MKKVTKIKPYISILLCMVSWIAVAQQTILDNKRNKNVIDVNKRYKSIMIFPEEISEIILGNDLEFSATIFESENRIYHRRIVDIYYVREAKAVENMTNLNVITKSGDIYEFLIRASNYPAKTSYQIFKEDANGNIGHLYSENERKRKKIANQVYDEIVGAPFTYYTQNNEDTHTFIDNIKDSKWFYADEKTMDSLYIDNRVAYYKIQCRKNQRNVKIGKGRRFSKNGKTYLWLKGVYYHRDEIYVDLEIQNLETVDYVVDFVKSKLSTNYKDKSTDQSVNHKPAFIYNPPGRVDGGKTQRFQLVFNRFTISQKRILEIEIKEKNGERDVSLKIPQKMINNPIEI